MMMSMIRGTLVWRDADKHKLSMFGFHTFVEHDGFARTVILLLLLTTVGCMSYTWGYWEVRFCQ